MAADAAISLDAIARHPELARSLTERVREELSWRLKIVSVALEASGESLSLTDMKSMRAAAPASSVSSSSEDEELLDYGGAARFLERSVAWVRNHPRECGGIKLGRMWRFPRSRLRALLQQKIEASLERDEKQ